MDEVCYWGGDFALIETDAFNLFLGLGLYASYSRLHGLAELPVQCADSVYGTDLTGQLMLGRGRELTHWRSPHLF
jgi:hypothetical protein